MMVRAALDTVEVYDPQADSWQRVASMPRRLHSHAAAVMGGKIYVTGGLTDHGNSVNSVYVYDPQANAWTQLASMGTARRLTPPQRWEASSTSSAGTAPARASQHGGGLRPCFGQLGASDQLDLRAQLSCGGRSLSSTSSASMAPVCVAAWQGLRPCFSF